MQDITITDIKLMKLEVTMNEEEIEYQVDYVQAMLQIEHDFVGENKYIMYHIIVGENAQDYLFSIDCKYQFQYMEEDSLAEEVIKEAMRILEPRIEELLAFVSNEGGFLSEIRN